MVQCVSKNIYQKAWTMCSKCDDHSSQHNWEDPYDHLTSMRILITMMHKIIEWASKLWGEWLSWPRFGFADHLVLTEAELEKCEHLKSHLLYPKFSSVAMLVGSRWREVKVWRRPNTLTQVTQGAPLEVHDHSPLSRKVVGNKLVSIVWHLPLS